MPRKYTKKKQNIYYYVALYNSYYGDHIGKINGVEIYKPLGELVFLTKQAARKHIHEFKELHKIVTICCFPFNLDGNNVYESCGD